ncbi:hypothetical protein G0U57_001649, partial [Chelydra serpentina]
MTSLESEEAAGDNAQPGPPSPASLGGSAPTTDPLAPPDQAAAERNPGGVPAGRDRTSGDPPTPTEVRTQASWRPAPSCSPHSPGREPRRPDPALPQADPLDPFDRERLFDLLFRSQSRRLNEQRCPLPGLRGAPRHPPARPWHSLPGTPTGTPLGAA